MDTRTKKPASIAQCIIRNITFPLGIIEFAFLVARPNRRLGDLLAGTEVIKATRVTTRTILSDLKDVRKSTLLAYWVGLVFLLALFLYTVIPKPELITPLI